MDKERIKGWFKLLLLPGALFIHACPAFLGILLMELYESPLKKWGILFFSISASAFLIFSFLKMTDKFKMIEKKNTSLEERIEKLEGKKNRK